MRVATIGVATIGMALAILAGSAVAQTNPTPPPDPLADPLAVKPIPPHAQAEELAVIRTKVGQAGYTDISDLSRDSAGVWRGRARKDNEPVDVVVDKGGRIKATRR